MDDSEIFQAIGEDGFTRLVAAFYRQVPGDDILGPMYPPGDLPPSIEDGAKPPADLSDYDPRSIVVVIPFEAATSAKAA